MNYVPVKCVIATKPGWYVFAGSVKPVVDLELMAAHAHHHDGGTDREVGRGGGRKASTRKNHAKTLWLRVGRGFTTIATINNR